MKKGCIVSIICMVVLVIVAAIVVFFGLRHAFNKLEESMDNEQYKPLCSQFVPIITECNPEELKKYVSDQGLDFTSICKKLKVEDSNNEPAYELEHWVYHEKQGVAFCTFTKNHTLPKENLMMSLQDSAEGPKITIISISYFTQTQPKESVGSKSQSLSINIR